VNIYWTPLCLHFFRYNFPFKRKMFYVTWFIAKCVRIIVSHKQSFSKGDELICKRRR
jgi:hypothetical protein